MSALGDEYTKAAHELAELINRHQSAYGRDPAVAAKLQDEALAMFQKVESLYKRLQTEYAAKMRGD